MSRDRRSFIRVDVAMPDHPKVASLSAAAFRVIVSCWCYSARNLTDGIVPHAVAARYGPPRAVREVVAAGLLHPHDSTHWRCHDYLEHQSSRAEVEAHREQRRAAGGRGGRAKAARREASGASEVLSDSLSTSLSEMPSGDVARPVANVYQKLEVRRVGSSRVTSPQVTREVIHNLWTKTVDNSRVVGALRAASGRPVSEDHARRVTRDVLDRAGSTPPRDPTAYVLAAINREPARYLPTPTPPPYRAGKETA